MSTSISIHSENPFEVGTLNFSADAPMHANSNALSLCFASKDDSGALHTITVTTYCLSATTADLLSTIGRMREDEREAALAALRTIKVEADA